MFCFCIQDKEKNIESESPFSLDEFKIKLVDLKKNYSKLSEILLTSIENTTDLYNVMEDYELKYAKNEEKAQKNRII